METYFLRKEDINRFYAQIAKDFNLYVPMKGKSALKLKCDYSFDLPKDDYFLDRYSKDSQGDIAFNEYRAVEPTRALFTHAKEEVCDYFSGDGITKNNGKAIAISGIKNCDLFSLKIQDFVFLGGNESDPIYQKRRKEALIISGDCPSFKEACFCGAFGINPHPAEGFDFNLSPMEGGYLLDVGSDKAKALSDPLKDILILAAQGQLSMRAQKRETVIRNMHEHLAHHKIPKKEDLKEIVLLGYESQVWQDEMPACVECGGCVFICDTCHCFLLNDEKQDESYKKVRSWDGCLYKNFSTVAGGANPLKMRYMRLRNRYLKKFDFFIDNAGFQACCGCGRCIEACPGKIDIRRILRRLYEEKYLPAH